MGDANAGRNAAKAATRAKDFENMVNKVERDGGGQKGRKKADEGNEVIIFLESVAFLYPSPCRSFSVPKYCVTSRPARVVILACGAFRPSCHDASTTYVVQTRWANTCPITYP